MPALPSETSWAKVVQAVRYVLSQGMSKYQEANLPQPLTGDLILCKGENDIAKGEEGDMKIYHEKDDGSWFDPGYDTIKVLAELGEYKANKKAYVKRIYGKNRIINTECG